uniref:Growth hormone-inducible transmembrane protein n=2 Tax=Pinctada TaxID=50425 RepID=A0A060CZ52_PINIB|nr:growth hormone-inducible transmembrane protein [Pinctada imbricata]
MLAARLCRIPLTAFVPGVGKQTVNKPTQCMYTRFQTFSNETGPRVSRRVQKKGGSTIKEKLMAPAGDSAFTLGKGAVAGASALGLGALCFYGLGMSKEVGAVDKAILWSEEVRQRVRSTYMYFGGSVGLTALSAVAVSKSPALMNLMMKNSLLAIGATFAVMIGSGMVLRSIPYKEGLGKKQLAWMTHCGIMGAIVAPLTMLGGPLLVRAAWYTAGIVGGLSAVAMCAPSEKFLNMGGPLACGLGVVFVSSIGSMFLPPTSAVGAGLYSISIYGGLVLFGLFLLYDTQKVIKKAETHPVYSPVPFDPVNACLGIYMDTLNIFIRVAMILANGGGSRRK